MWERKLSAVGDAGIKAAAAAKQGNYATGVQQGQAKFLSAITKILAFEQAGLSRFIDLREGDLRETFYSSLY